MKTRRILVAVDNSPAALARVESAINLANIIDAQVTAILAIHIEVPPVAASTMHGGWYMGEEIVAASREEALQSARMVKEACDLMAERFQWELAWIQKEGDAVYVISEEARYHDVLILGRPGSGEQGGGFRGNVHSILLESGVPCLVMPDGLPGIGQQPAQVVLAWNGGRECYQAMRGAMPFLVGAEKVTVLTMVEHSDETDIATHRNERAVDYLSTHGVNAHARVSPKEGHSLGQSLADQIQAIGPDLVVMGAYGHSRFRETILGGATRQLLLHAGMPVLFAH